VREIKFRAKTLEGELLYFDLHESQLSGDPDIVFYVRGTPCKVGTEQEYTGLPDKNGKEIYEGDIVKAGENIVLIIWNKGFASFALAKTGWMYDHFFGEIDNERCEVIGNRFENPELLEGVKP